MGVKGRRRRHHHQPDRERRLGGGFLFSQSSVIRLRRATLRIEPRVLGSIAALGVAPFIMQSTESLVTITLNSGMQKYGGDLYVGTITILQSIMQMLVLPLQGVT